MVTFNNTHIFTGYLKQLLLNFNLSTYYNGKWSVLETDNYFYNKYIPNLIRNYRLTSNVYDSYTHEYLGDYLRFHRDYFGVDLMPLYNCFSNNACKKLILQQVNFDASDKDYTIYMIPVKLGDNKESAKLTIAIDSSFPIEVCCGLYGKYQLKEDTDFKKNFVSALLDSTYQKFNSTEFSTPVLYDKIYNLALEEYYRPFLIEHEKDLKLFIKVPANLTSSIVVLEGDHRNDNNSIFAPYYSFVRTQYGSIYGRDEKDRVGHDDWQAEVDNIIDQLAAENQTGFRLKLLNYITNCEYEDRGSLNIFKPISQSQLLSTNTGRSYPFSDRLIEYLIGQAITPLDEISDDFVRIQTVLENRQINEDKVTFDWPGIWENKMRVIFYDFMNQIIRKPIELNGEKLMQDSDFNTIDYDKNMARVDTLGYVDKDIEKFVYGIRNDKYKNISYKETLMNVDIYPEIYLSDKHPEIYDN